ncbi:hypothetical protein CL634_02100 [bacterium]|nr:hypothetical protein [bacterium]
MALDNTAVIPLDFMMLAAAVWKEKSRYSITVSEVQEFQEFLKDSYGVKITSVAGRYEVTIPEEAVDNSYCEN